MGQPGEGYRFGLCETERARAWSAGNITRKNAKRPSEQEILRHVRRQMWPLHNKCLCANSSTTQIFPNPFYNLSRTLEDNGNYPNSGIKKFPLDLASGMDRRILFEVSKAEIMTIGERLDSTGGVGRGFDFLRVFLATAIVAWHCASLSGHARQAQHSMFWFAEYMLVPMFFALSGFLVTGSASRLNLHNFMLNRVFRIVPALAVDIFTAALVIGPIFTTVAFIDYYTERTFFSYFFNIIGWIHFLLPGVFKENPTVAVNGALWTVPYEILCYIVMAGLMYFGILRNKVLLVCLTAAVFLIAIFIQYFGLDQQNGPAPAGMAEMAHFLFTGKGPRLVMSFLLGIIIFLFRHKIPYSKPAIAALLVASVAISAFATHGALFNNTLFHLLALPCVAYLTVLIGLTSVPVPQFLRKGDYSYGIYLYHAPFIQAIISLNIAFFTGVGAWLLFPLALPIVLLVAYISWHCVEKPALMLRKRFSFTVSAVHAPSEQGQRA